MGIDSLGAYHDLTILWSRIKRSTPTETAIYEILQDVKFDFEACENNYFNFVTEIIDYIAFDTVER